MSQRGRGIGAVWRIRRATGTRAWRRALALLLPVLVLCGCGERDPSEVRFALAAAVQTLDPRLATDAASTRVGRLIYARLTEFNDRFEPVPALARWERLTPTRYRFHLDPGRRPFHDGNTLSAADVSATYQSVLDPASASPHRGSLSMLDAVQVVDGETVDFLLNRPDPLFPGRLSVGILPAPGLAAGWDFSARPVGSGPMRFVARPDAESVQLQRDSDGQLLRFVRVKRPDVRVLKLLRGEVDLMQGDMPPELLGWLEGRPEVEVHSKPGTTFAYLGFNLQDPVVGNARVRSAIAHAIDRERIIRYVWAGRARAAGGILTPDHWAGHPGLSGVVHAPGRARALLREAGYGEHNPARIVYKTSTSPVRVRLASVIQDQLARVGIEVEIRTYDWGTFYGDIKSGNFQMYSLAWVGIEIPDIYRYIFHSASFPPAGANRGRYVDREVDRLIDAAEATATREEQVHLYRELQERVMRGLPYVPLWYEDQVYVARRDIQGYRLSADGNYDALVNLRRVSAPRGGG